MNEADLTSNPATPINPDARPATVIARIQSSGGVESANSPIHPQLRAQSQRRLQPNRPAMPFASLPAPVPTATDSAEPSPRSPAVAARSPASPPHRDRAPGQNPYRYADADSPTRALRRHPSAPVAKPCRRRSSGRCTPPLALARSAAPIIPAIPMMPNRAERTL